MTYEKTISYDEKLLRDVLSNSGKNEEKIREMVNHLARFTNGPIKEIMNIVRNVYMSVELAAVIEGSKEEKKLIANSFMMSIIGNMMPTLQISEEEMKDLMPQIYAQCKNIKKQNEEESK